jgi:hypothetical protein
MSELRLPLCPICKEEVLLPFSITQYDIGAKTFGNWVCTNCGFYITTRDTRAINPKEDIETGFIFNLRTKMNRLKKDYQTSKQETSK